MHRSTTLWSRALRSISRQYLALCSRVLFSSSTLYPNGSRCVFQSQRSLSLVRISHLRFETRSSPKLPCSSKWNPLFDTFREIKSCCRLDAAKRYIKNIKSTRCGTGCVLERNTFLDSTYDAFNRRSNRQRNAKRPLKYHYSWNPDTVHVFSLNTTTLCGVVGLCHSFETRGIFFFLHIVTGLFSRLWRSLSRAIGGRFEAVDLLETFSFVKLEFAFSPTHRDGGLPGGSSTTPRISPVETMDQRITAIPISCTVFPLDPGYTC